MKKATIRKELSGYVVHVVCQTPLQNGAFEYQTMGPFNSRIEAERQRERLLAVSDGQYDRIYDDLSRDFDVRFTMGGISITNRTTQE